MTIRTGFSYECGIDSALIARVSRLLALHAAMAAFNLNISVDPPDEISLLDCDIEAGFGSSRTHLVHRLVLVLKRLKTINYLNDLYTKYAFIKMFRKGKVWVSEFNNKNLYQCNNRFAVFILSLDKHLCSRQDVHSCKTTIGWILLSAAVFCIWEDWSYFTSIYFFFISCLGDVTPDHPQYMIATFGVVMVGLSLVTVCIDVIKEKLELMLIKTDFIKKVLVVYHGPLHKTETMRKQMISHGTSTEIESDRHVICSDKETQMQPIPESLHNHTSIETMAAITQTVIPLHFLDQFTFSAQFSPDCQDEETQTISVKSLNKEMQTWLLCKNNCTQCEINCLVDSTSQYETSIRSISTAQTDSDFIRENIPYNILCSNFHNTIISVSDN
uniref:Ion_trans_2 domain-containing protein n=1 Tax=Heterorhabditis bacteriophora TaxID=37862 RepID=A0A1I7X1T8_HETBA